MIEISELTCEYNELKKVHEKTLDELFINKEKYNLAKESISSNIKEIEELKSNIDILKEREYESRLEEVNQMKVELQKQKEELQNVTSLVTKAEELLVEKEREISWLNEDLNNYKKELKVNF